MLRKLLLSGLAVIGLLLVGPQKASADQLFYCKNPAVTNQPLVLYTASPTCPPGTSVTSINVQGPPGTALGGASFSCVNGTELNSNGGSLAGSKGMFTPRLNFGSGITYANGTTFLLQPGIYQVQLSIPAVIILPANATDTDAKVNVQLEVNSSFPVPTQIFGQSGIFTSGTRTAFVPVNGDVLFQISAANSVVGLDVNFTAAAVPPELQNGCQIVFTQLQ